MYFNFTDTALKLLSSYLLDGSQRVTIVNVTSSPHCLEYGVPQHSIFGPLLFALYKAPLQDVMHSHSLDFMFYADNTQICISNNYHPIHPVHSVDQACIDDVHVRTTNNMLMCNLEKLKYCISYPGLKLVLANTLIAVKTNAKNLGVVLDETSSFTEHTNEMCKKASYAIESIMLVIFKSSIFHSVDLKCWWIPFWSL